MYNIIKVHPQDRVRREGTFGEFSLDMPGAKAEQDSKSPASSPDHSPLPGHQQPAAWRPPAASDQAQHQYGYVHLAKLSNPREQEKLAEGLKAMEPSLTSMNTGPRPHCHLPALPTYSRSHLSPMHAALPPLQTRFAPSRGNFGYSMQPSPVSPSPLTAGSPPVSPIYESGYYSHPHSPISPIRR